MRALIFSDVHGNIEALNAVLKFAKRHRVDRYICLGDLVGYGASPNETIQKIQTLKPLTVIRGNHDKAVSGHDSIETFNPIAAAAIQWTKTRILKKNLEFLDHLPKGPLTVDDELEICHGAPFDEDYYIFGEFDAAEAFDYLPFPLAFFGHTHFPVIYSKRGDQVAGQFLSGPINLLKVEKGISYLINPGSVGQPRDRNPRAAFAIYDRELRQVRFHRVEYEIAEAQKKILQAELPSALAERLTLGL
ncbi:MAG: metallophosphoesterase family protein [Candidatus Aminicenantes bacterium]|nr:metallophosphoesterase family protein [Candidatus Aminicenantes bacterium]